MTQELAPIRPAIVVPKAPSAEALKPVQRRAILALLECPTVAEAAEAVGKSERTLFRWLRDPLFRACLDHALATREQSFEMQAIHAAGTALSVLTDIAITKYEPRARVNAARHILEYADRQIARRK